MVVFVEQMSLAATFSFGLDGEKSPAQQSRCFAWWELEGHPSNWQGQMVAETKTNKWKLLPCLTVGSKCLLTQLHGNIPLAFPN